MQLRYVFSELGQGLRRNLSMHIAVILTLFVSLTLVGFGVLLREQSIKATDQWGSELQITVFLCKARDDNPACTGEVTDTQKQAIAQVVDDSPEVDKYRFESKDEAFQKVKELLGPEKFEGSNPAATAEDMPQSIWITLNDPDQYQGITSAIVGLDGVSQVRDQRDVVGPLLRSMKFMQRGSLVIALVLVAAALLLVGNTIRLAAFARRREISIMRLVGASRLYITLPFLMEALVTAAISLVLSLAALGGFMYFGVDQWLSEELGFIPWIDWADTTTCVLVVAILAPVLTLLPTLVVTRKYLKV
ncbi:cell division protein FtsX [Nocardioides sp. Root1257]|uniref:permease-like cell division protein FtsX n=1 Tax=unclassified Nocardioides TaxID=2615069 RepID=UPI00070195E4|nr:MULTISPECIES: permease-like cell division protein FtsX [unclassified Nocardioides]KQW49287.1 cell division protein FtsX [Nocardioides sp. Root1257]KRC48461.1 cell division protein FtsX [Nocardioides sp. Root224]